MGYVYEIFANLQLWKHYFFVENAIDTQKLELMQIRRLNT